MDSCVRGAFLSGVGFLVSLKWLQAVTVSNSAIATTRLSIIDRQGTYGVLISIDCSCFRSRIPFQLHCQEIGMSLFSWDPLPNGLSRRQSTQRLSQHPCASESAQS